MYESPELVFAILLGPYLYDVYLAMMLLTAVTFVITEMAPRWYNPWWVRRNTRKLCKNLSRMKLLMILIEYWSADKWKGTYTAFKRGQSGPSRNTSYWRRFYTKTKGGAKVKNKGVGIPHHCTTVCEGARRQVTHNNEPTASERAIATGYDPGDEDSTEPTVHTVVCNVNTSLLTPKILQARHGVLPGRHGQPRLLLYVPAPRYVRIPRVFPRRVCQGGQGQNPSHREGHHEIEAAVR
jgi:hypothetical protein